MLQRDIELIRVGAKVVSLGVAARLNPIASMWRKFVQNARVGQISVAASGYLENAQ